MPRASPAPHWHPPTMPAEQSGSSHQRGPRKRIVIVSRREAGKGAGMLDVVIAACDEVARTGAVSVAVPPGYDAVAAR